MSKCRVQSKYVNKLLRAMGANKKRNLHAFKVVVGTEETFFEEARPAISFAARRCKMDKTIVRAFENVGGEQYILLATYEFDAKAAQQLAQFDEDNGFRMPNTWVAKGDTSIEAWAFALTHPTKVATIVRQR